jgi:hypothetical protein
LATKNLSNFIFAAAVQDRLLELVPLYFDILAVIPGA